MKCFGRYIVWFFCGLIPVCLTAQVPDSFVLVPGGAYLMGDQFGDGSQDELPVHRVVVRDFYLSPYELTTGEYLRFVETTHTNYPAWLDENSPYHYRNGAKDYYRVLDSILFDPQRPIVGITWTNAVAYCNWLSAERGLSPAYQILPDTITRIPAAEGYRLPTEAEWEYAARERGKKVRFGTGRNVAGASDINVDAREAYARAYITGSFHRYCTMPVRTGKPNALGLYHMSGNVWEWCQDWYDADCYARANQEAGPATGTQKVLRGGSWYFDGYHARCSNRHHARPDRHFHAAGMRMARNRSER